MGYLLKKCYPNLLFLVHFISRIVDISGQMLATYSTAKVPGAQPLGALYCSIWRLNLREIHTHYPTVLAG